MSVLRLALAFAVVLSLSVGFIAAQSNSSSGNSIPANAPASGSNNTTQGSTIPGLLSTSTFQSTIPQAANSPAVQGTNATANSISNTGNQVGQQSKSGASGLYTIAGVVGVIVVVFLVLLFVRGRDNGPGSSTPDQPKPAGAAGNPQVPPL